MLHAIMINSFIRILTIALTSLLIAAGAASAHPHVWVTMKSAVVYGPDGSITGVRHAWTFDDMYSAFAVQGLESKKKGEFTTEELKPLAQVNVESLKEYDFFTYAKANGKNVAFAEPVDYSLEFNPQGYGADAALRVAAESAGEGEGARSRGVRSKLFR